MPEDKIKPITPEQAQIFEAALRAPIPKFYANAFASGLSPADIAVILQCNGSPVALVNLSYQAAKQLSEQLRHSLNLVEKATKTEVKSVDQMSSLFVERQKSHD